MIQLIQQYRIIEQIFGKEKVLSLPTGLKSKESILQNHVKKLKLFEHYKSENQIKKYMNSSTSVIIEKDPPHLERDLKRLIPWRKGPFQIGKHHIHAEWDCRLKWERLRPHLPHLKDKVILDIGCNNGYFSYRLSEKRPKIVIGLEPHHLYYFQSLLLSQWLSPHRCSFLPLSLEEYPMMEECFDFILHLGVIYHQKNPYMGLEKCYRLLKPNGTMILEALTLPDQTRLIEHRYQNMNNIWMLPSIDDLIHLLKKVGFVTEIMSQNRTSVTEQNQTEWAPFQSLNQGLNSERTLTIEGLPIATRSLIKLKKAAKRNTLKNSDKIRMKKERK